LKSFLGQYHTEYDALLLDYSFFVTVHAVSNNVRGRIIESNIRCMNGIIHVVDTLLNFPYWTVEEVMEKTPQLK
jgi:uncharacterized membrane protein